ncbi:LarC family nickel insertion protein [Brevibacillus ginsengisoli]|uniref:LarC family nickel insertion protein n=1 Tax=Brevibacillus ginsengisoli TaxID=363854 RepID=UPI003CF6316F
MRIAYIDCFSGISGDMMFAALVDAGADLSWIEQELYKLPVSFELEWNTTVKKGVSALKLDVHDLERDHAKLSQTHNHQHAHMEEPDHDQIPELDDNLSEQLPEHHDESKHDHDHHQHHEHHHHDHHHEHDHKHHHDHHHHHRGYHDIVEMIKQTDLSEQVKKHALAIFYEIGKAESKIHNIPIEVVHFHEVGAVDSIVDIVGVSLALENLGIEALYCGPVPTGNGFVRCDHGLYPVPAPATLEILKDIPLRTTTIQHELTTPTGAGVAKALVSQFGPLPAMTVERIGYGAGTRDLEDQPNVLRILIGSI